MKKTSITTLSAFILICIIAIINTVNAQSNLIKVTGKVIDTEYNEAIIGASVLIKGTNNGTITDINGEYTIQAPKNSTLVFSYIGYITKEIKATTNSINVSLEPDNQALEEVVVTGYGIQRNMAVTGSVSKVRERSKDKNYAPPVIMAEMAAPASIAYSYDQSYNYNNDETYDSFKENRFISPLTEALSTFSVDVDAASYTNFRRYINQGQKPPKDAIRVEEFINYFSYSYDQPTDKDPVKITTEVGECPWAEKHRLVRIGVKAKEIANNNLLASNFVFLIDVSGSMYGPTRLDLVKSSLNLLINNLRDKDRVAIVVYSGNAGEVLPSTSGSDKQKIREALDKLTAGGSTAGGAGIKLAYKIAKQNFVKEGNNRIILCTDGDFNVGVSSNQGLENLIEEERKSGVFLSILGYGMGNYKDDKMQILAQKGNGNAAYIDNLQEANRVLVNEFGGTLFTVAKDVKLQIEFNPAKVQAYRLVGYESRLLNKEDFNDDTKDAGEMGAGHTVTALYEVVPVGVQSNIYGKVDDLKYQSTKESKKNVALTNSPELLTVKLRYKQPDADKSVKMEIPLIDNGKNNVSSDLKFASAVAMFAQLFKDSEFKGNATYDKVINLAKSALDNDKNGYRHEFVRLTETVKSMN
ncbi:MAG: von Willebrand factor type A domain-containing protein [Dysgonomonas sp.]|nr:von Willebrand factor type A domain-containing protein [Dysgonomonas sp.]